MEKANRNDERRIKEYGEEVWNQMCDYTDDKNERMEKLFAEVIKPENMEKLFDKIRNLVNIPNLNFTYNVNEKENRIYFQSDDISNNPLICLAWKEFRITQFSCNLTCKEARWEDRDYSKRVENVRYWTTIEFYYKHHDGGSNGAEIAYAEFTEDLEWQFQPTSERYM